MNDYLDVRIELLNSYLIKDNPWYAKNERLP